MVRIRLQRTGKTNRPSYRIVVINKPTKRDGKFIDMVGNYDPISKVIAIDHQKYADWISKGAQPSVRVSKLVTNDKQRDGVK